jgi:acyl transferase domain-containing protein
MQKRLSMLNRKRIVYSLIIGYEPIAIIAACCRFPGVTEDLESIKEFEEFIIRGGDAIRPTPHERWNSVVFYSSDEKAKGRLYVMNGSLFRWDCNDFDAALFVISPKEATVMYPQLRLILEIVIDCLYNAKAVFYISVEDPLNSKAIRTLLKADNVDHDVALTSIKSGLGHQEAGAGAARLLKASPQAWLKEIYPAIQIHDSPLYISQDKPVDIGKQGCPTVAAVNSFSYGATNAHVMAADYA